MSAKTTFKVLDVEDTINTLPLSDKIKLLGGKVSSTGVCGRALESRKRLLWLALAVQKDELVYRS